MNIKIQNCTAIKTFLKNKKNHLLGLVLLLATFLLYSPALFFQFLLYDDNNYIYENPHLQLGLSLHFLKWAFTTFYFSGWTPLTWLSWALDWKLYGLWPGGYHLTNIIFHAANSWLVFILFSRMTGAIGKSFLIAAIFAWHPVAVESVAWISERKDVLSTFFILLSLLQYAAYVKSKEQTIGGTNKNTNFILCFVFFILSLLCKSMYVTFPIILILFDFWPLARKEKWLPRIVEKIPFILFSAEVGYITLRAATSGGAVKSADSFPLFIRAAKIAQTYWDYIFLYLWPAKLSIFYPYLNDTNAIQALAVSLFFLILTGVLFFRRKKIPALWVGWCLFVISLMPVIGMIPIGAHWIACRYLYWAATGLSIFFIWGGETFLKKINFNGNAIRIIIALILVAYLSTTSIYLKYWKNSDVLFKHALDVAPNNSNVHMILRSVYGRNGDHMKATEHLLAAIDISPSLLDSLPLIKWTDLYWMGAVSLNMGNMLKAESYLREAAELLAKKHPQGIARNMLLRDDSETLMRDNLENCLAAFDSKNPSACVLYPK